MISYQYLKLCHMCNISIMKISGLPLIKQNVYITKIAFPESKSKNYNNNVTMIVKFGTY